MKFVGGWGGRSFYMDELLVQMRIGASGPLALDAPCASLHASSLSYTASMKYSH